MRSHSSLGCESRHILSANDIQRLRQVANATDEPVSCQVRNEKATLLKSISLNHIRKWESKAQKVKKAQREIREEAQRRRDLEDAQRLATERKAMLKRAELEKYNNTDEVKSMLTGMLLADIAHENLRNENLRKARQRQEKQRMDQFLLQQQTFIQKQLREEQERTIARKDHDKKISQIQRDQLAQYLKAKQELKEKVNSEGRKIAAENARAAVEAERKAEQRAQYIRDQKMQSISDNIRLQEIRDRERDRDKVEMEKIAAYAAEKERKEQMRREVAERRHQTKLRIKQRLIDIQAEELKKRISNEDEMIAIRIQQNEAREERRRQTEKANQIAQKRMLDECRQRQICEMQARKAAERQQALELQAKWTREKQSHEDEIQRNKRSERQVSLELQEFHKKQMMEKNERERCQKEEMRNFVKDSMASHQSFVGELKRLTASTVEDYAREGKNVLPIHIALAKNPSFSQQNSRNKKPDADDLRYMDEVSKCLNIE